MIWLSWRQFRAQAVGALVALAALSIYLLILGLSMRHTYDHEVAGCSGAACTAAQIHVRSVYKTPLVLLSILVIVTPALIGGFWGAPLVTRELEAGTHRLVWTQGLTRRSWLAARIAVVGAASVLLCGLMSLFLTWTAQPFDRVQSHFAALSFDARDVVPIAYAAFAFALGLLSGLLLKRTLPAMAVTLAVFTVVQLIMAQGIRPHLMTPVSRSLPFNARTIGDRPLTFDTDGEGNTTYIGYQRPGAWVTATTALLSRNGRPAHVDRCFAQTGERGPLLRCVAKHHVHWVTTYQPPDRYGTFQAIELALFLALAGGLAAVCLWRIPYVTA